MKKFLLATTALALSGGMAAADVEVTGSAELGVAGKSGTDVMLHKELEVVFKLSGETDTGLAFGGKIDLDEAGDKAGKATVHVAFGPSTLTLGDTDSAYDSVLDEVGTGGGAIADDHTGHAGYNGNGGIKGFSGNGGNTLRYDFALGGITASLSGEFSEGDSSHSAIGVGAHWQTDIGGLVMDFGLGWQAGSGKMNPLPGIDAVAGVPAMAQVAAVPAADGVYECQATSLKDDGTLHIKLSGTVDATTDCAAHSMDANGDPANGAEADVTYVLVEITAPTLASDAMPATAAIPGLDAVPASLEVEEASIIGASWKVQMGNGLTTIVNYSRKSEELVNAVQKIMLDTTTTHMGLGVGYEVGNISIGLNGGTETEQVGSYEMKSTGVGIGVKYGLGTGADFLVGAGSGSKGGERMNSWSAGLSFAF